MNVRLLQFKNRACSTLTSKIVLVHKRNSDGLKVIEANEIILIQNAAKISSGNAEVMKIGTTMDKVLSRLRDAKIPHMGKVETTNKRPQVGGSNCNVDVHAFEVGEASHAPGKLREDGQLLIP